MTAFGELALGLEKLDCIKKKVIEGLAESNAAMEKLIKDVDGLELAVLDYHQKVLALKASLRGGK